MLKYFKNNLVLVSFFEFIFRFLGFITSVYVARIVSADGIGMLSIANSILVFGTLFSSPGLHIFGIKYLSQSHKSESELFLKVSTLRLIFSLFFTIVSIILIIFFVNNILLKSICIISAITILPFTFQNEWYFQSKRKISIINFGKILFSVSQLLLTFYFLKTKNDLIIVPVVLLIINLLLFVYHSLFLPKFENHNQTNYNYKNIIFESIPIGISSILLMIFQNLPILFLGYFSTFTETGLYSTAYKIILTLLIIDRFLFLVVFPKISFLIKNNIDEFKTSIQSLLNLLFIYFLVVSFFTVVFGRTILSNIWGLSFINTFMPLTILLLYFGATLFNSIFSGILISTDNSKYYSKTVIYYSILFIILLIIFRNDLNSFSVSIIVSATELFMLFIFKYKINTIVKLKFLNSLKVKNNFLLVSKYF